MRQTCAAGGDADGRAHGVREPSKTLSGGLPASPRTTAWRLFRVRRF